MQQDKQSKNYIQLMDILSEKSNDSQLNDEFWTDNGIYAKELAVRLNITPVQATLLYARRSGTP